MIRIAIALAFAGASIACGVTLPEPDETDSATRERGAKSNGQEPTSTLGATLPAPNAEVGDGGIWSQPEAGTPIPGTDATMPRLYGVFVTSGLWSADAIGGLSGADQKCKSLAEAILPLKGRKWAAWLSVESTSAKTRLGSTPGPWFNGLNKVADDIAQLVDPGRSLHVAIMFDEKAFAHNDEVWTGTFEDGSAASQDDTCSNWSGTSERGVVGQIVSSKPGWTSARKADCVFQDWYNNGYTKPKKRLYCFEID